MQWKLILAGVVLAALGGLLWHDHHQTARANRLAKELSQAEANYEALQKAQAHERKIASEASTDYENRLQALQDARSATPTRSVRLCKQSNTGVSTTPDAASGTAAGTAAEQPAEAGSDLEVSRDIGPELYAQADENDQRAAQCNALIRWVRSR
jgi:hypothetical protein